MPTEPQPAGLHLSKFFPGRAMPGPNTRFLARIGERNRRKNPEAQCLGVFVFQARALATALDSREHSARRVAV